MNDHRMGRINAAAIVLFALGTAAAADQPTEGVVSRAVIAPYWRVIELQKEPCENGGQKVRAIHVSGGYITGCWIRGMQSVFVRWDDGDFTAFIDAHFLKDSM